MDTQQPERRWDIAASLLLLLALLFAAGRLAITDWVPHLPYAVPLAFLGGVLGLALGASRFRPPVVALLAVGYTAVILPWQLSFITQGTKDAAERLTSLGGRLASSLALLVRDRQVDDYVLFLGLMCLLFWGLAIFAGYALARRGDAVGALLPAGLAIVVISVYDFYGTSRMAYLGFYLFLSLAILGRLNYLQNRRDWSARRVSISPDAAGDLSMSIAVSAALIIVAAWSLPMTVNEYQSAAQFWSDAAKPLKGVREKLRDAFAAVSQPVPVGRDYFDETLTLGTGNKHSDAVLLSVKVPEEALSLPRLYWRGRVYDHYEDGEWETTAPDAVNFRPESQLLPLVDYSGQPTARYVFTTSLGGKLLYTPSNPVWVSRAAKVEYVPAAAGRMSVQTIASQKTILRGETYQARAPVRNPTELDLRVLDPDYPDWVTETYLQLPEGFSPEIRRLAIEITQDQPNTYDKVKAVTNYLRSDIAYSERISAPPAGADPVEWLLFEGKTGFCNYYASAEVLMLRSIGIPARLVAGFSQGEKNETGTTFTVRDNNAHAWPEVYFPGFGWVEFEPTGNQDPLLRPSGIIGENSSLPTPAALTPQNEHSELDDPEALQGRPTPVGPAIGTFAVWFVIGLAAVVLFLSRRRLRLDRPRAVQQASVGLQSFLSAHNLPTPTWLDDWVRWLRMSEVEQSFHAVNQGLRWLGDPQPVHATPAERAAALGRILPEARQDVHSLLAELHTHLFSPARADPARAAIAARRVRSLALRKRLSRIIRREKHDPRPPTPQRNDPS